ncbi:MAG: ATP-binding cassette domain-containing protein [Halanaerobiaceae bacterium]
MIIFNKVSKANIENLSFYINSGEMVCINDNNTDNIKTLFDLFQGAKKVDQGVIRYLKNGSYYNEPDKNLMGYVFKDNILLPDRTVDENMQFIMRIKDINMSSCENRIKRIMDIVDLKFYMNKRPGQLLSHQIVRANIAQAILSYPPVLILEDPFLALDEVNRMGIIRLLKRLNEFSMTVVILSSQNNLIFNQEIRIIKLSDTYIEKKKGYYA